MYPCMYMCMHDADYSLTVMYMYRYVLVFTESALVPSNTRRQTLRTTRAQMTPCGSWRRQRHQAKARWS